MSSLTNALTAASASTHDDRDIDPTPKKGKRKFPDFSRPTSLDNPDLSGDDSDGWIEEEEAINERISADNAAERELADNTMDDPLEEIQDSGEHAALCDRWRIYHGEPEDVRWARISIDAAKFDGRMFDGLALMEPNALAEAEPRVCRKVNAEMRGLLKQACLRVAEVEIEDPRLVGVDPLGFDIRGRFDVVRLDADPEIVDEADAFAALEELATGGEDAPDAPPAG